MLEELRKRQELVKERILKSFGYDNDGDAVQKSEEGESLNDLIRKGVVEVDDALEKAVYADTAENRKLGRVGQEYHRGKGKSKNKGDEKSDKAQAEVKKYSNMYLGKKFVLDLTGDTHRGPSVTSGMAKKPHEGTITKVWFDKDTKQTTVRFQTGSRHIDYFASQIKDRLKPVDSKDNRKSGGSESKISSAADAAKFLKENAEKYMDYQYDDEDMDDETRNNFKAASKYIKMGKTLTAGSKEAIDYEEKMSKRGYHVIDVTPGSGNQSTYALIKKNN